MKNKTKEEGDNLHAENPKPTQRDFNTFLALDNITWHQEGDRMVSRPLNFHDAYKCANLFKRLGLESTALNTSGKASPGPRSISMDIKDYGMFFNAPREPVFSFETLLTDYDRIFLEQLNNTFAKNNENLTGTSR